MTYLRQRYTHPLLLCRQSLNISLRKAVLYSGFNLTSNKQQFKRVKRSSRGKSPSLAMSDKIILRKKKIEIPQTLPNVSVEKQSGYSCLSQHNPLRHQHTHIKLKKNILINTLLKDKVEADLPVSRFYFS